MTTYYCGIDIGIDGGISFLCSKGTLLETHATPTTIRKLSNKNKRILDIKKFTEIISQYNPEELIVYIEEVHAMPSQGSVSGFSFGDTFGQVKGICGALGYNVTLISSMKWKNFLLGKRTGEVNTKYFALQKVKKLFPGKDFLATPRSSKQHDGMFESALIAYYAYTQNT